VEQLRQDGYHVSYIAEFAPSVSDDDVLRLANDQGALLLTVDKDFGELVFRLNRVAHGVVLARLERLSPDTKARVVANAFRDHGHEMLQSFSVITPGLVRIRPRQ
jgi:predicted nuclease of predicted toxin-antitoxin system